MTTKYAETAAAVAEGQKPVKPVPDRPYRDDELWDLMNIIAGIPIIHWEYRCHLPGWFEGHELLHDGRSWQFIDGVVDFPITHAKKTRRDAEAEYMKCLNNPNRGPELFKRIRALAPKVRKEREVDEVAV